MTNPNPFLSKLGFGTTDRAVIVHADDVCMCQSTLPAVSELFGAELLSSCATMVPCPWFSAAAKAISGEHWPDIGVHTTLTSEWESYRWGPISTRDRESGLMAEDGCFPQTTAEVQAHARHEAVRDEVHAQVERAVNAGIDITHIDSHMGALIPRFLDIYVDLAIEYRVPAMLMVPDSIVDRWQPTEEIRAQLEAAVRRAQDAGLPMFDRITMLPLDDPDDRIENAKQRFDSLPAGLSVFILHPAKDTPELRAIAPDYRGRVADYEAFGSSELLRHVRDTGVQIISYRQLRDAMRS